MNELKTLAALRLPRNGREIIAAHQTFAVSEKEDAGSKLNKI